MRKIKWFYDTTEGVLYDANGYQEGARVPAIYAGELAAVEVQLCVGAPQFDEQGAMTNPDASYATTAATGEFVVDNDYNHVSGVALGEALTSGVAVNAIKITAGGVVRPLGTIRLDASHAVNYCAAERDASGKWVLTTANDTYTAAPYTPSANYDAGEPAVMVDMPIIVGSNADASDKATGIFRAELDANNPVYLQLCEDTAQIGGTMIEFSVYVEGRPVLKWRTLLDCLSAIALPPSQEYYPPDVYPALDSRYVRISGGGESPVGIKADYTAFEVYANSETIPAGSTAIPDFVVDGVGPAVDIPAGMTHACKFKTLGSDIIIDWGDGTIVTKPASELTPDGSWTGEHTYASAGKYLVKVYGGFSRIQTVSGKNLVHRVLDFDLPLASTHTNLQEFAQNALRLVAVNFNDQLMASHIGQLTKLFSGCTNLRRVEKMNRLAVVASCNSLFQNCFNMRVCEFACPPVVALADDGANGLRNVFYSTTQDAQWAVTLDLNSLFPTGGFAQDAVDLSNFFYHAGTRECFGNITLTAANAEKLAKKLWLSGKKFIGFSDLFLRLPAAVRKYIPYAWGGTMAGVYIDSATGCLPKWQGVEADYSWGGAGFRNRFTGDAVELLCDAYEYGRIAATNCTVTFTDGFVPKGDVTLYGGTFSPNGGAVNILSAHYAVVDMSPMGMQSCALDHCYATGLFDVSTGTAAEVAGGTIVVTGSNRGAVFTLSDNALMTYADSVSEITVVYTKGCTINGEVKAAGGTIVVA